MDENKFKTKLIKDIKKKYPGCIVAHLDASDIQGIPDLLILYENKWAVLEGKKSEKATFRPNQERYVEKMNNMSFASVIFPENREDVLKRMDEFFKGENK